MSDGKQTIAILGGTGDLGTGLAQRWIKAGYKVIIGSRKADKAVEAANELASRYGINKPDALANEDAAAAADLVVLTVPFEHQKGTLEAVKEHLQGKILIDVTVPLMPPKVGTVQLPAEGSAAEIAQATVGEDVQVVSAFQNVAAHHLQGEHEIDCDILVAGNKVAAREEVIALAEAAGMRAFHAGPLANSAAAEALTSILIQINRRHKCHAGIRISGLDAH
jgi:NADPH-dependent F420 reductase